MKQRWHNASGLCLYCGRLPREGSAYCSKECCRSFVQRLFCSAGIIKIPMAPKIVDETLRRLLSGPVKRSELPNTKYIWEVIRTLNREMETAGRKIVTRHEKCLSRLGLTVKETVYELITLEPT